MFHLKFSIKLLKYTVEAKEHGLPVFYISVDKFNVVALVLVNKFFQAFPCVFSKHLWLKSLQDPTFAKEFIGRNGTEFLVKIVETENQ